MISAKLIAINGRVLGETRLKQATRFVDVPVQTERGIGKMRFALASLVFAANGMDGWATYHQQKPEGGADDAER